ncbi:hypothetical protein OSSY52_07870 [Tepiditoga spiralis]|uniref:Clostripain n=1 Tax=Tepiditoga spiralis TaxID=2108365 RepID=A0A7G1G5S0_9BACT|nr:clostripain-related cysteine peptidase [Tepiditoga spiralis]BBE30646.1 hypothetical protein OSSY52_07870 [Tepiditoga spiralis]
MKKIFKYTFILISFLFLMSSCIPLSLFDPLITNEIIDGNFDKVIEFKEKVKNVKINGTVLSSFDGKNYTLSRTLFTKNNYLEYEYNGKIYKKTLNAVKPDLQLFIYACGDTTNSPLSEFLEDDINEIKNALMNVKRNILVTIIADFTENDKIINLYNMNGKFYRVETNPSEYGMNDEINSSNPDILYTYMEKFYIGNTFFLDLWNHGNAWEWESKQYLKTKAVIVESSSEFLKISDIKNVLKKFEETHKKIDVIGFDACSMAQLEIVYELSPYANYFVGSVNEEPGYGWNYNFLRYYDLSIEFMLSNLVAVYYDYYNSYSNLNYLTMTAIRLNDFKNFVSKNLVSIKPNDNDVVIFHSVISNADFCDSKFAVNGIENYIINSYYKEKNSTGLGILYKTSDMDLILDYKELDFYKDFKLWIEEKWKPF